MAAGLRGTAFAAALRRLAPQIRTAKGGELGMNDEIHVCTDMVLKPQPKKPTERMALVKDKLWADGFQVRVRFLEGDPEVQARVKETAKQWQQHANIYLQFVNEAPAHVRIAFKKGAGSWSYIGKDAEAIDANGPTMNLGWLAKDTPDDEYSRVVLHEFGHALGCIHEHQHPDGGIQWNKPLVYDYYKKTNGWDAAQVDAQIFATYDESLLTETKAADKDSIMMYPIPPGFATNIVVGWNKVLSPTDKTFIRSVYPF
jgi:serralysin